LDREPVREVLVTNDRLYQQDWREVVLLLAGILCKQSHTRADALLDIIFHNQIGSPGILRAVRRWLTPIRKRGLDLENQALAFGLLGAILRDLKPYKYLPVDGRLTQLQSNVMAIFESSAVYDAPIHVRIEAAEALGMAGDPRLDRSNATYYRPWIPISSGCFLMGAQNTDAREPTYAAEAMVYESPVHEVFLDEYEICRYPVTVVEYLEFIKHGGYANNEWWSAGGFEASHEPQEWNEQQLHLNRPVVGVSWFEANAYCKWWSSITGDRVALPTEAEWERAARGINARKYPWGTAPPSPPLLNYVESKIGRPTPVGIYPLGATPDGICDLAGNVWEWCHDWYNESYYGQCSKQNPQGPANGNARVVRGGSWNYFAKYCRASLRFSYIPKNRLNHLGFRMVRVGPREL
jgi:formylglycine-generating enzyme required for sulfatase activity